ncbi:hypothetical protein BDP27DRAFT_1364952 [Rhodocollybia butyracea]|uniref:Uncharacterized protein n=1 Tax=Rhodocollybia butyracea TaxID=206335 RepID=A0A9P5U705_9AGAR|nr:hypothetical protein BDP27DRAFT_1364952 [Rhodocollybia butyracea]
MALPTVAMWLEHKIRTRKCCYLHPSICRTTSILIPAIPPAHHDHILWSVHAQPVIRLLVIINKMLATIRIRGHEDNRGDGLAVTQISSKVDNTTAALTQTTRVVAGVRGLLEESWVLTTHNLHSQAPIPRQGFRVGEEARERRDAGVVVDSGQGDYGAEDCGACYDNWKAYVPVRCSNLMSVAKSMKYINSILVLRQMQSFLSDHHSASEIPETHRDWLNLKQVSH